jgi:hypothetical protein
MTRSRKHLLSCHASWLAAAVLAGCLFMPVAHAEDTGFEVGLRLGYGIPLGNTSGNEKLSDGIGGQVPIIIDLGYRVIPNLFVGLYGQYGFSWVGGNVSDACDMSSEISCSAHDIRLGVEAQFHFLPRQKLDPWVGLGVGYEWMGISVEGGGVKVSMTPHGFEFVNLQAGLDILVAEHFYLGPFLSLSIAQYSDMSVDCSAGSVLCNQFGAGGTIQDKALHEWLMLGVRGAFAP